MALDADDFDLQGLESKLTASILSSFDDAMEQIKFTSVGTSLVSALKSVKMSKVIEDSLTKSTEVKTVMKDIQKKLEDGFNKIKFQAGEVALPEIPPQMVKVLADTSGFVIPEQKPITVPINADTSSFGLPEIPSQLVKVLADTSGFTVPEQKPITVPVNADTSGFIIPEQKPLTVPINADTSGFTVPELKPITVSVNADTSGFTVPELPKSVTIDVVADTSKAEDAISNAFSTTQIPMTPVTTATPAINEVDTTSYEAAGDLVKQFVNLTTEANKKTVITESLYNNILDIASKLVEAKRMEKDAVDEITSSLQSKVAASSPKPEQQPTATLQGPSPTAAIEDGISGMIAKLDKTLSDFLKKLSIGLSSTIGEGQTQLNKIRPATMFDASTGEVAAEIKQVKTDLADIGQIQTIITSKSELDYQIARDKQQINRSLVGLHGEELAEIAKKLDIQAQSFKNESGLKLEISNRLAQLKIERNLKEDILSATEAYNQASRQSKEDLRTKNLIVQLGLTEDEVAQRARLLALDNERLAKLGKLTQEELKQLKINKGLLDSQVEQLKHDNTHLRHERESVELVEHVAEYQKEINEELEHFSMSWKKVGATIRATLTDPTLAKGVIFASSLQGIHALAHSMHEFKEVGMGAGEAVAATFKSLSVESVLGLSKSSEVTKTLAQNFGNLNALTKEQVNQVGKLAANNGLAGEEATNLVMAMGRMPGMTRESAANSEKMFKEIGKTKGVIPAQIMKEVAKNTNNMAIYSKGGAEGFAKAAASAKRMGVELSSVLSAAEKTLDFENSINAQMEASVILGRELNVDRLRQVTLSGDANAILQEQQNLIRQAGGLENMDVMQKQKVAELLGMSVEEMQKINDEAQFQNQYFGEQASLTDNLVGNAIKYGEAIASGVTQFGPLIASVISLASNMVMLNTIKAQNTVLTTTNTGAIVGNTGATTANASAGGFWNTVKGISNGIMNSSIVLWIREKASIVLSTAAQYASAAAQGAWNLAKGVGNALMSTSLGMWVAEKIQIGLSTAAKWLNVGANTAIATTSATAATATATAGGAAAGASVGFLTFGATLGTFGTLAAPIVPILLAVGGAILLVTPALYVLGEVVKSLAVVVGNVLMKALEMLPAIIGAVAQGFVTVFQTLAANWPVLFPVALAVGALSLSFVALAGAISLLGGAAMLVAPGLLAVAAVMTATGLAVYLVGQGLNLIVDSFNKLKEIKTEVLFNLAKAVGILGATAALLAPIAPLMIIGSLGIAALGYALGLIAPPLQQLLAFDIGQLTQLGIGLLAFSGAMSYIGLAAPFIIVGAGALYLLSQAVDPLSEAFKKLSTLKIEDMPKFGQNILEFATATAYLGLVAPLMILGSAALYALSFALKPLAESFKIASEIKPEILVGFGAAMYGFGVAAAYLGLVSPLIVAGSIAIAALGFALKPFAESMKLAMELKPESMLAFGKAVGGFAVMAALLGTLSPLIILGSVSIGLLGLALQPVAKSFEMVQKLNFGVIETFGKTVGVFALAAAGLGILSPLILLGSTAVAYLGLALIPVAKSFEMVQKLDMKAVENFGLTVAKFAAGAALLAPLAPLMILGSIGILMLGTALQQVATAFKMAAGIDAKGLELFAYSLGKFSAIAAGLGLIAPLMILGATGIVILGAGLNSVAGAFKKVEGLNAKSIELFGFAVGKFSAIAAGLGVLSPLIMLGSMAILYLGTSLGVVADSFIKVATIDSKKIEEFGLVLGKFALGAAALAPLTPLILLTAFAIGALGMSFMPFANAMAIVAPASEQMSKVLKDLATKETLDNLELLSSGLMSVAKSLGAIGLAGILAMPALLGLSAVSAVFGGGAKAEGVAPEAKGIAPSPAPVPAAAATTTNAGTATTTSTQSTDMSPLVAKLDELINIMRSGGTIVMDGQKVADVVQRNIKTLKFAD